MQRPIPIPISSEAEFQRWLAMVLASECEKLREETTARESQSHMNFEVANGRYNQGDTATGRSKERLIQMKRICSISLLVALVALATLPRIARADGLTISGVGPTGLFGPGNPLSGTFSTVLTQSNPIAGDLAPGSGVIFGPGSTVDEFTWALLSTNPVTGATTNYLTLTGLVFANYTCSPGVPASIAATGCTSLFVDATAADPGNITGLITLSVDQTFALPNGILPFTSLTTPGLSTTLIGTCNTTAGNVTASSTFDNVSYAGTALSSGACTGNNAFSAISSATGPFNVLYGADMDINNTVNFNLNGGSITIPAGSCLNSTCVEPSLVPPTSAPEPGTILMLTLGLAGLGMFRKRASTTPVF